MNTMDLKEKRLRTYDYLGYFSSQLYDGLYHLTCKQVFSNFFS